MLMDGHFGFPAGVTGFTPRGVGLTPVGMQITASQGGISAIVAAQDQEEERKRRTETIVGMMSRRWGFVSQEGVKRCATRLGLECLWEEGMGEERKRTLTIAGHGVLVDVEFRDEVVRGVVLQFEGSRETVVAGAGAAGEVLGKDLKGEEDAGYVILDPFVGNLERLAGMDRLGGAEVNCLDAVDGIYRSLDKVFRWEVNGQESVKSKLGDNELSLAGAMCRQSGRPMMHTRGRVGLALHYWAERRLLSWKRKNTGNKEANTLEPAIDLEESMVWSAIIECEASPAELFPPVRISDTWVSEAIVMPTSISDALEHQTIDWLDPPPTFLPPKSPTDEFGALELDQDAQPRTPDVRFVARFEPPVIVPMQTAMQIHTSVGSPLTQESFLPTTYESLVFSDIDSQDSVVKVPRSLENPLMSYDMSNGTVKTHRHRSTLFTQPNDYARAITDLPFSHPRQIIALLPCLRQWALTASILRRSFMKDDISTPPPNSPSPSHPPNENENETPEPAQFQTIDAELEDFMSSPLPPDPSSTTNGSTGNATKAIDITLTTHPLPRFNVHFPDPRHGGKLASVSFNIGLNGTIEGVDVDDGSPPWQQQQLGAESGSMEETGDEDDGKETIIKLRERVTKVLEISESIGVCVEWMSRSTPP